MVDAFKAGLAFDPPVIAPSEFRSALRKVGYPLHEDDQNLDPPVFDFDQFTDPLDEDEIPVDPPEENS